MSCNLYLSLPCLVAFDNEPDPAAPPAPPAPPTPPVVNVDFTPEQQAKVNAILAEEKRKTRQQNEKLEKQLQDTLATAKLTSDERVKLEESLEDLRKQSRTKEEQAKLEKKQLEEQYSRELNEWKSKATLAENKYLETTISRSLKDAATGGDAFNADIVVTVLRPMVKMVGETPMIDFQDVSSETGEPIVKQMTPDEAIKRMKQLPEKFGGLFKSNVSGGIGGSSATGGLKPGEDGRIDPRRITNMDQYLKLRKENPAALGLK